MEQWHICIIINLKLNKRCCYEIHEHSLFQLGKSNETIDINFAYSSFRTTNQFIKTHSLTLLTVSTVPDFVSWPCIQNTQVRSIILQVQLAGLVKKKEFAKI